MPTRKYAEKTDCAHVYLTLTSSGNLSLLVSAVVIGKGKERVTELSTNILSAATFKMQTYYHR
jgi:hypothetical protein